MLAYKDVQAGDVLEYQRGIWKGYKVRVLEKCKDTYTNQFGHTTVTDALIVSLVTDCSIDGFRHSAGHIYHSSFKEGKFRRVDGDPVLSIFV